MARRSMPTSEEAKLYGRVEGNVLSLYAKAEELRAGIRMGTATVYGIETLAAEIYREAQGLLIVLGKAERDIAAPDEILVGESRETNAARAERGYDRFGRAIVQEKVFDVRNEGEPLREAQRYRGYVIRYIGAHTYDVSNERTPRKVIKSFRSGEAAREAVDRYLEDKQRSEGD